MLSIEKCRELIPGSQEYTDGQIESIRHDLYGLAELAVNKYLNEALAKKEGKNRKIILSM